jgi:hypothetical protein
LLYYNQCPHCLAETIQQFPYVSLAAAPEVFKQVQKDIIAGFGEVVHPQLYEMYRDNYHKAINSVLGNPKANEAYFDLAEKFKLNTARVAAYKSHYATSVLKDVYQTDPTRFPQKCDVLLKTFNRWQATEYNTATARTRTAKQWSQFQSEADQYPNLEWLATRSSTPRELHASFVGLILPQNDKFWQDNQPGNLYNCKCDWRATDKAVNKLPDLETVKPAPGLDGNPATTGEVFSDSHPYYKKAQEPEILDKFVKKSIIKPAVTQIIQNIEPYTGLKVVSENLQTGQMIISRRSVKEIVNHNADIKVQVEAMFLKSQVDSWEYLGYAIAEEKHAEAAYFFYYKTSINKKTRYVNMIVHKHFKSEVPYAITDEINISLIKKGVPADLEMYIKK